MPMGVDRAQEVITGDVSAPAHSLKAVLSDPPLPLAGILEINRGIFQQALFRQMPFLFQKRYRRATDIRPSLVYIDYNTIFNNRGSIEKLSFPNKAGLITIDGKGLRVLDATDDKITFMVLKD